MFYKTSHSYSIYSIKHHTVIKQKSQALYYLTKECYIEKVKKICLREGCKNNDSNCVCVRVCVRARMCVCVFKCSL